MRGGFAEYSRLMSPCKNLSGESLKVDEVAGYRSPIFAVADRAPSTGASESA